MKNVLISGGSIAGPSLAYWLTRYGYNVTIVELTPGPRKGGQAIDVRGPALTVADRMGILESIRANSTQMRGMSMVDADGKEVYRSEERTLTGGDLDSPDVEILRDDLSEIISDAIEGNVEYLYSDTVTALDADELGVRVIFARSEPRTFDIVVGADGLHSTTRRLAFGDEARFIHHLGTYLAVWSAPNFLDLDRWQVFHQMPGSSWGGGVMSVRNNTELRAYVGFESKEPISYDFRDTEAQKLIMQERLGDGGWILPKLLKHMWEASDFHFDSMSQIRMDSWSRGRVVLLGDAGYCGSPLSGQGTSMAMVGAYVLAGELKAAAGDHSQAFPAYERKLREYVGANQQLALTNKIRVEAQRHGEEPPAGLPDFSDVVNGFRIQDY